MKVKVAIVNAFVDSENGGNPAGVVLDADALNSEQKLAVAQQVGLSETAFVSSSEVADFKLDFFTPQKQIAHCGHATIATFSLLSQLNKLDNQQTSKETIDGKRDILVTGDFAYMSQLKPSYSQVEESNEAIYQAIGVSKDNVISPPIIANTGNSFLIVGVATIDILSAITPNLPVITELSEKYGLIGVYVYTLESNVQGRDASTRMFAPYYGITEEAATGMAAGPLACFLYDRMNIDKDTMFVEQGYAMAIPSPSCIEVVLDVEQKQILGLKAGGVGKPSKYVEVEI
ncbi:PhzF family phenazine biosynthesis protein [Colwelliaceae bacterium 6441]